MALSSLLLLTIILATTVYVVLKVLSNRRRAASLVKQLPNFQTLPSVPLLGSAHLFKDTSPDGILRTLVDCHHRYGKNLVLQELGNEFKLLISEPRVIEQVMQAKTILKPKFYRFLQPWIGLSSVLLSGERWSTRRKLINPAFHYKMLDDFLHTMIAQADVLVQKLSQHANGTDCDIYEPLRYCAMDIICETAMGVQLQCQTNPNVEFVQATEEMIDLVHKRMFNPLVSNDLVYSWTDAGRRETKLKHTIHRFTSSVIRERKKRLVDPPVRTRDEENRTCKMTFLDLLLETRFDGQPIPDKDIRGEVDTFMFAGHETVTSCMSFLLYFISRDETVQQRLYDEIVSIFGDSRDAHSVRPTYASLQDLKYMEQVIKETLRISPSVPMIGRTSAEDMVIDGVPIPPGTDIMLNIYVMQNDPDYYPEPDRFRPERFADDGAEQQKAFSYLPFSLGVRSCIGQRFAILEMKTMLVKLLTRFRLGPCEEQNVLQLKADLSLKPFQGAFIKILER
ncbi:cytochrome P450 4d2-like [Anopheles nili]|uniref:cytochrome P450 4d2-like n=1 Tax=Anopheles nili TaxID=185578 RepID=UPI00237B0C84|nr:cytochrome P450 4d2-like [Anopheles nili]